MVCIPCKKAFPEQQDLKNCPGPCQDMDRYNSPYPSLFSKGSQHSLSRLLIQTMLGNTTTAASLCIWDFIQWFSDSESWDSNTLGTIQLSLSWRETGSQCWMISQGHSCQEFIWAGLTYFHSLVPWDRGSLRMDSDSPHTLYSKEPRPFK